MNDMELPINVQTYKTPFFDEYAFDTTSGKDVLLGKGGFSKVLRGVKKGNGKTEGKWAIKCIDMDEIEADGTQQESFQELLREKSILQEITHPNVVRLGGFYEDKPNRMYWMVLELMEGGELFERIVEKWEDHGGYTEEAARETSGILLHTVAYLHERNIAHRDLKPENLLCKSMDIDDAQLKLADFGFAVKCNGLDQRAMLGTPGYVAPEILNNQNYGTPVDMWSCGVIIFVILGGYPPFPQPTGNNNEDLYKKICDGDFEFDPQWWGGVSDEAKALIQGCLTVDVSKRLTAKQALEHPWFKAEGLGGNDLSAGLSELKKWNARRKLKAAVNTVIAINKVKNLVASIKAGAAEEAANSA